VGKRERLKSFASESELCRDFIDWAKPQGWQSYPETAGWDILLVHPDGWQLGIQAKLRFNATLLRQTLPSRHATKGPDFRGVLLPTADKEIADVLAVIGLAYFRPWRTWEGDDRFVPEINLRLLGEMDWSPADRCRLPAYVPDCAAGASSPVVLTEWKIKALRAVAMLELAGSIKSKDLKALGMDTRRWTNPATKWLLAKDGTRGSYVRGTNLCFDAQHPKVYAEIREEVAAELASAPAAPAGGTR
jgi:hypothetical protein